MTPRTGVVAWPRKLRSERQANPEAAKPKARKYVYFFGNGKADGNRTMKDLLGGKGSGLAEMTNAGSAGAARLHDLDRGLQHLLQGEGEDSRRRSIARSTSNLKKLEKAAGAHARSTDNPLLVSVRSGAKFSMPGMMDTILNLGLNDAGGRGAEAADAERPLRVRQLPPLHPDVRQRRARDSEGRVRARVRRREEGARREARHRPRRGGAARGRRALQGASCRSETGRRVPAGSARAAEDGARRGVPLLDEPARAANTAASTTSPITSAPPSTCR